MRRLPTAIAAASAVLLSTTVTAAPLVFDKLWTFDHALSPAAGQTSEIVGNEIDPSDRDGKVELRSVDARGFYQPDGMASYSVNGQTYRVMAKEVSGTTSVFSISAVPEPGTWAMMAGGPGLVGWLGRCRRAA